ncbi:MAG: hypothetical protein IKC02_03305, partial [Oscillospiraceae bacterium]|nr:hypothetical protein [Oscillospiraceae bacterium]
MKRRTLKRAFKVTALVLALLMVAMIGMTGCGAKGGDENVKHKIGVILYGKDDAFGAAEYAYINSAAEALDVEIQWALNDYDAESQLASAENLVAAGCEGLLFLPLSDNTVSLISDYCLQNEIWFQMMNRDISDPDIKAACQANPFYVGTSFEANEDACQTMTEMMAAEGRLNYGLGKIAPGSSLAVRNT